MWVLFDMFFGLWPYAIFGVSHIEEISLPFRPYKHKPKKWGYHQLLGGRFQILKYVVIREKQKIPRGFELNSFYCGYSVTCFLAFGLMQFLECPTSKNSSSPFCLISVSRRERSTISYIITDGILLLRFTSYKVESGGRLFRCGTLRMLRKSQRL